MHEWRFFIKCEQSYKFFRFSTECGGMLLKPGSGTGNGERESGNKGTVAIPIRIQNRLFNAT